MTINDYQHSRLLTYISSDDVEAPLTPAHFLMGRRTLSVPDSLLYQCEDDDDDVMITHEQLNKRMWHLNVVLTSSGRGGRGSISLNYARRTDTAQATLTPVEQSRLVISS